MSLVYHKYQKIEQKLLKPSVNYHIYKFKGLAISLVTQQ